MPLAKIHVVEGHYRETKPPVLGAVRRYRAPLAARQSPLTVPLRTLGSGRRLVSPDRRG